MNVMVFASTADHVRVARVVDWPAPVPLPITGDIIDLGDVMAVVKDRLLRPVSTRGPYIHLSVQSLDKLITPGEHWKEWTDDGD